MNGIELILAVVLVLTAVWGYRRGVVMQIGSVLAFVLAIVVCRLFGDAATDVVASMIGYGKEAASAPSVDPMSQMVASIIGHVALFLIVWLGVGLTARALKLVVHTVHLGIVDRLAGALFMAFKAALVASFVVNFAEAVAPASGVANPGGELGQFVKALAPTLLGFF